VIKADIATLTHTRTQIRRALLIQDIIHTVVLPPQEAIPEMSAQRSISEDESKRPDFPTCSPGGNATTGQEATKKEITESLRKAKDLSEVDLKKALGVGSVSID
jgi:hypothetical protein